MPSCTRSDLKPAIDLPDERLDDLQSQSLGASRRETVRQAGSIATRKRYRENLAKAYADEAAGIGPKP
jgi:hypothetical protein